LQSDPFSGANLIWIAHIFTILMRLESRSTDFPLAGSRERFSAQRIMAVTQVAVSMVLLVGALLRVLEMDRESWAFSSVEILKGRAIQDGETIRALQ
jgi:hypothetical protein